MKKLLLSWLAMAMTFTLLAQITLDENNVPRSANFSWERMSISGPNMLPEIGENVDLDYSSLQGGNLLTRNYNAPVDPAHMAATSYYTGQYDLVPGLPLLNRYYQKKDANGYGQSGIHKIQQSFGIGAISGSASDSLIFSASDNVYAVPRYYLKFPTQYGDEWESNTVNNTPFSITVAAFGLSNAPGAQIQQVNQTNEVVGWGTLRIPTPNGVSIPYDILIVKQSMTIVSNYTLYGQPAPAPLLNAFGLTNGDTNKENVYLIYTADFESPLMSFYMNEDWDSVLFLNYTVTNVETDVYQPIVLTEDNTPRTPLFTWQRVNVQGPNPLPALGAGVHLDYTDLLGGNVITRNYQAPLDAAFSDATRQHIGFALFVPGLPFESRYYQTLNSSGYSEAGFHKTQQSFGIGAMTGSPTDSLIFPDNSNVYAEPRYNLKFPTKYGDSWSSNVLNETPYILNVAAMGLNNAPGVQIQQVNQANEVVGWGTLRIPTPQGPSIPYEILIVKQTQTVATNYTLFGQPAPPAMLAAFGLQEGTFTSRVYEMYSPNFETYLMQFGMDENWVNVTWINYTLADVKHEYTVAGKAYHHTDIMDGINMVAIESDEDFAFTDVNGMYSLQAAFKSAGAAVSASKDNNSLNGVSTFDAVLITRHILGIETLQSPYAKIAADINNNGIIEIGDVIQMRRLIILLDDNFVDPFTGEKNNESWRFVPADHILTDPAPTSNIVPEYTNTAFVGPIHTDGHITQDFIGVKIGDVNGSANPQMLTSYGDNHIADLFNRSSLLISVDDVYFKPGDIIEIPLNINDIKNIAGMQWALNWNPETLNMVDLVAGNIPQLNKSNFNLSTALSSLFMSWNNEEKILRNHEPFTTLRFEALASGKLSESLAISNELLRSEVYFSTGDFGPAQLQFTQPQMASQGNWEIYPNPSSGNTRLSFELPLSGEVTIEVYDVAGRLIFDFTPGELPAGSHNYDMAANKFPTTGTYILKFDATDLQFSTRIQILQE